MPHLCGLPRGGRVRPTVTRRASPTREPRACTRFRRYGDVGFWSGDGEGGDGGTVSGKAGVGTDGTDD